MPSIVVKSVKSSETKKIEKLSNVDIMKRFNNIKVDMDNMKGRMLIHEFIGHTVEDDVNYDLIYA